MWMTWYQVNKISKSVCCFTRNQRSAYSKVVLTLVSGSLSDSPKLLELIREGQAGDEDI